MIGQMGVLIRSRYLWVAGIMSLIDLTAHQESKVLWWDLG